MKMKHPKILIMLDLNHYFSQLLLCVHTVLKMHGVLLYGRFTV